MCGAQHNGKVSFCSLLGPSNNGEDKINGKFSNYKVSASSLAVSFYRAGRSPFFMSFRQKSHLASNSAEICCSISQHIKSTIKIHFAKSLSLLEQLECDSGERFLVDNVGRCLIEFFEERGGSRIIFHSINGFVDVIESKMVS